LNTTEKIPAFDSYKEKAAYKQNEPVILIDCSKLIDAIHQINPQQ
jgi:hypothetical protein